MFIVGSRWWVYEYSFLKSFQIFCRFGNCYNKMLGRKVLNIIESMKNSWCSKKIRLSQNTSACPIATLKTRVSCSPSFFSVFTDMNGCFTKLVSNRFISFYHEVAFYQWPFSRPLSILQKYCIIIYLNVFQIF